MEKYSSQYIDGKYKRNLQTEISKEIDNINLKIRDLSNSLNGLLLKGMLYESIIDSTIYDIDKIYYSELVTEIKNEILKSDKTIRLLEQQLERKTIEYEMSINLWKDELNKAERDDILIESFSEW